MVLNDAAEMAARCLGCELELLSTTSSVVVSSEAFVGLLTTFPDFLFLIFFGACHRDSGTFFGCN